MRTKQDFQDVIDVLNQRTINTGGLEISLKSIIWYELKLLQDLINSLESEKNAN